MEWWDEDPELLGATLGMLAAWHDDGSATTRGSLSGGSAMAAKACPAPLNGDHDMDHDGTDSSAASSSSCSDDSEARPRKAPKTKKAATATASATAAKATATRATTITTTALAASTPSSARTINVSRERRKQELQALRDQCAALQRELRALRDRREALLAPHFGDAAGRQLVSAAPVWENMATRQFQARRKSEARNMSLRRALEAQARVAHELMRVLQRAQQQQQQDPLALMAPLGGLPSGAHAFRVSQAAQRARLDRMCARWTDAYALWPKFRAHGPLRFEDLRTDTQQDGGRLVQIDLFSSQVLPFAVARVEEVMWGMFNGERGASGDDAMDVDTDDGGGDDTTYNQHLAREGSNTLTALFTTSSSMGGATRGSMSGNWIIRRFGARESCGSRLVVSQSFSEPRGFGNELDGGLVDDDSWARIVDAHVLGHTHLPAPLSVVQHVRRVRIAFAAAAPHADRVEAVTRWYEQQIRDELAWAQQTLESELMDMALSRETKDAALPAAVNPRPP